MTTSSIPRKEIGLALLLAVLFAGAYGQLPLYSSNQNTYFLQGVAHATAGPLLQDWLVNTTNHIPVFSAYVQAIVTWLSPTAFYFVHAFLVTIYAFCLLCLMRRTSGLSISTSAVLVAFLLLAVMHSSAVVEGLRPIAAAAPVVFVLDYTTEGLAGLPLLRHFHQPSAFAVLLLVSLCAFLSKRTVLAAASAALAPWFHASYFLAAAVMTAAFMLAEYREGRSRQAILIGVVSLLVVLPPLLYTWMHFRPTSPEIAAMANQILVHKRFPHHAWPQTWFGVSAAFQLVLMAGGLLLARRDRRLFTVLASLLLALCVLTLAQIVLRSDSLAMLLPWRLSILLVPISTALIATALVSRISSQSAWFRRNSRLARNGALGLLAALAAAGIYQTVSPGAPREYPVELTAYVSDHCSPGDAYLIPLEYEWFRLATLCPAFVDWKSHPYRDTDVLEWFGRVRLVRRFYEAKDPAAAAVALRAIREHASVTHVVVTDDSRLLEQTPDARVEFRGGGHLIYRLGDDHVRAVTADGS